MQTNGYHLAQVNIARMVAPLDNPVMTEFVDNLDRINALAESSPGYVWRLKGDGNDATSLRPYDDEMIIVNLTVWKTVEDLQQYVYHTAHTEIMRKRKQFFSKMEKPFMCMWWIPAGHIPDVQEAKTHLDHLQAHGESDYAFTFRRIFSPPA